MKKGLLSLAVFIFQLSYFLPEVYSQVFSRTDFNIPITSVSSFRGFVEHNDYLVITGNLSGAGGAYAFNDSIFGYQIGAAPNIPYRGRFNNILYTENGSQFYSISNSDTTFFAGDTTFQGLIFANSPYGIKQLPDKRLLVVTGSPLFDVAIIDTNSTDILYKNPTPTGGFNFLDHKLLEIDPLHYLMRANKSTELNLFIDIQNDTVIELSDSDIVGIDDNFIQSHETVNNEIIIFGSDSIYFMDANLNVTSKDYTDLTLYPTFFSSQSLGAINPVTNTLFTYSNALYEYRQDTVIVYDTANNFDLSNFGNNINDIAFNSVGDLYIIGTGNFSVFNTSILANLNDAVQSNSNPISIYPNPFDDKFNIKFNNLTPSNNVRVFLTSINGKKEELPILEGDKMRRNMISISGEGLNSGFYILTVESGGKIIGRQKLIKD